MEVSRPARERRILLKGNHTNGLVGFNFDYNVRRNSRISWYEGVVHYVDAQETAWYLNVRSDSEGHSSLASERWGASRIRRESANLSERKSYQWHSWLLFRLQCTAWQPHILIKGVVHYVDAQETAWYLNVRSDSEGHSSLASERWEASRFRRESANLSERKSYQWHSWLLFRLNVRRDSRIS
jgi:hypothetical protein